jgi:hypothetical protein
MGAARLAAHQGRTNRRELARLRATSRTIPGGKVRDFSGRGFVTVVDERAFSVAGFRATDARGVASERVHRAMNRIRF